MLDREKVVAVLKRRFPGSTTQQVAEATNALVGLEDEWVELPPPSNGIVKGCRDGCYLQRVSHGEEIRVFSRSFNNRRQRS